MIYSEGEPAAAAQGIAALTERTKQLRNGMRAALAARDITTL